MQASGVRVTRRIQFGFRAVLACLALVGTSGCIKGPAVLAEQAEARHLASELRVEFANSNEAANRAVMADTDEASAAAARESEEHAARVQASIDQLEPHLRSLGYKDEIASLEGFKTKFAEYRKLDAVILPLSVENTNLKAQRLSFNAAQEAVDALGAALDIVTSANRTNEVEVQVMKVKTAVLGIQVLEARHIAEADEATMDGLEGQMATLQQAARDAVGNLRKTHPAPAAGALANAAGALDRFMSVNREIVQLSRRNTNVRSLALTLGRKRVVVAECDDQLRMLDEALAGHAFQATR